MAKGNLFLGKARGSVGSVTFYQKNGEQISRSRQRQVANPSTEAQIVQRAVTSTVALAYKAGRAIFDHSFEGKKVRAGSQSAFMRANMRSLRSLLVSELSSGVIAADGFAVVVPRGAFSSVPWTYRVSEGSLYQSLFTVSSNVDSLTARIAAVGTALTLGEYVAANGLTADDIFTVVAFAIADRAYDVTSPELYSYQWDSRFGFIRFRVKESAVGSSVAIGQAKVTDLFEISFSDVPVLDVTQSLSGFGVALEDVVADANTGTMGVIRSRENSGERSTCVLTAPDTLQWGIKSEYLYDDWSAQAKSVGQSDLILEGGGF